LITVHNAIPIINKKKVYGFKMWQLSYKEKYKPVIDSNDNELHNTFHQRKVWMHENKKPIDERQAIWSYQHISQLPHTWWQDKR